MTPYLLPLPQTFLPSLVPKQHQYATSDTARSPSAGSPPRPSWAPRHSYTDGGKDGAPLPRCPACLVIFSPPVVDTSGVSCSMVQTQPFRNCAFQGGAEPLWRESCPLCLFLRWCLFRMDGSSPIPRSAALACAHRMPFFFLGHHAARYWARSTVQRKYKPEVYHILILTGLNISTMFTISPVQ